MVFGVHFYNQAVSEDIVMIEHHPSDETLTRLSAGDLEAGPALVVATHIAQCPHCRKVMRVLEGVGGAALDEGEPMPLTSDVSALLADPEHAARQRLVGAEGGRRGQRSAGSGAAIKAGGAPSALRSVVANAWRGNVATRRRSAWDGLTLPSPLSAYEASPWRMVGPGIHWARVLIPEDTSAKVLLLRAEPGTGLPQHTHTGTEYTCILQGAFQDGARHMQLGDLSECDETEQHRPMVNSGIPCVCVLAVEGSLVMDGWLARLAQHIVGL